MVSYENWKPANSVFFYSSRRRHTISKRDWSSDVALPISGREDSLVPVLPRCADSFGHGDHNPPSRSEPLRCGAGKTGNGVQSPKLDAGLQLSGNYDLSLDRSALDSPHHGNGNEPECFAGSQRSDQAL